METLVKQWNTPCRGYRDQTAKALSRDELGKHIGEKTMWLLVGGLIWRPLFEEFSIRYAEMGRGQWSIQIAMEDVSVVVCFQHGKQFSICQRESSNRG